MSSKVLLNAVSSVDAHPTLKSLLCWGVYSKVHRARTRPDSCSVTSPASCGCWPAFFWTGAPLDLALSLVPAVSPILNCSRARYSAKSSVLLRHCRMAFMKQVLPWFLSPATPGTLSPKGNPPQSLSSDGRDPPVVVCSDVASSFSSSAACSSVPKWERVDRVRRTLFMKLPTERTELLRKSFLLKDFFSLLLTTVDMVALMFSPALFTPETPTRFHPAQSISPSLNTRSSSHLLSMRPGHFSPELWGSYGDGDNEPARMQHRIGLHKEPVSGRFYMEAWGRPRPAGGHCLQSVRWHNITLFRCNKHGSSEWKNKADPDD